jgi:hypothetical protein
VSTLFHVIYFPHDGRIVAIDQLSFVGPDFITNPMTFLNDSYMQTISPPPQVNYVALSPIPSAAYEDDPLTIRSTSYDLDPVLDMVISLIGLVENDLLTPDPTLDMCSFQSIVLLSSEDLLEAMIDFCPLTWFPSRELSSWKP